MRVRKIAWGVALGLLAALPLVAQAQHRETGRSEWRGGGHGLERHEGRESHSGYWHHGERGGRLGWWWVVGGLWSFYPQPVYPYPDPYQRSTIVIQESAPVVVTQPAAPVVTQAPLQVWYYCEDSATYYPYVTSCATGWRVVPATPPAPAP